ncbi:MAG: hypothetical protein PHY48_14455 [Candidatus Cloacimonetes bacterium]|nr:hypothetical protein [Candidatus Cloacimonadota bacterium]
MNKQRGYWATVWGMLKTLGNAFIGAMIILSGFFAIGAVCVFVNNHTCELLAWVVGVLLIVMYAALGDYLKRRFDV